MNTHLRFAFVFTACALLAVLAEAQHPPRRRALLIGIDDYTASTLPRPSRPGAAEPRGWPDLKGAANDVDILKEMLVLVYGFSPNDIVTLKNQQATRAAILRSIEQHLITPAAKGDVLFYYFAGHGSQVPNPASDELDRLDESVIPADSRWGALDIRDKELRPLFNRMLDRGARLTLILDHCHSGSSFRGLPTGARPRGIRRARELVDPKPYGARPEERGALVFAASQDLESAWEIPGEDGRFHGSFTWAWIRAMRDAVAGEPAQETFLRAQARLRSETPYQAPVMLGSGEARLRPFLGTRIDRPGNRPGNRLIVAVEKVHPDGTVILQGGWANGLAVDTQLRVADDRASASRLRITQMLGLGRSAARMEPGQAMPPAVRTGALLEVAGWAAPPGRPLRVWAPRSAGDVQSIVNFARQLASTGKTRWLSDPLDVTPTYVLRPRTSGWELLDRDGNATVLGSELSTIAAIRRLPLHSSLFAQFPAPSALIDGINSAREGITPVNDPKDADYILVGRYHSRRMEYAWTRPLVRHDDRRDSALPQRTAWVAVSRSDGTLRDSIVSLRAGLLTLRRIHAWHRLESPPDTRAPYRLALSREKTKALIRDGTVIGNETYSVVLRAPQPLAAHITPRYYYAFAIDSHGKSYLTYPRGGSVENRFPLRVPAPTEIRLGQASAFRIMQPYGIDTYFLLSTEEPLPNPSILAWDGVRAPNWTQAHTPLEELLLLTLTGARGSRPLTTTRWSLERVTFESVAPRRRASR